MQEKISYKKYLLSGEWARLRQTLFKNQKVCRACGSSKNLHAHHMTYRRFGFEKIKNLCTLCKNCHFTLHDKFKVHAQLNGRKRDDLIIFTKRFIKKMQKQVKKSLTLAK